MDTAGPEHGSRENITKPEPRSHVWTRPSTGSRERERADRGNADAAFARRHHVNTHAIPRFPPGASQAREPREHRRAQAQEPRVDTAGPEHGSRENITKPEPRSHVWTRPSTGSRERERADRGNADAAFARRHHVNTHAIPRFPPGASQAIK